MHSPDSVLPLHGSQASMSAHSTRRSVAIETGLCRKGLGGSGRWIDRGDHLKGVEFSGRCVHAAPVCVRDLAVDVGYQIKPSETG